MLIILGVGLDKKVKGYDEINIVQIYFKTFIYKPNYSFLKFKNDMDINNSEISINYSYNLGSFYYFRYLNFIFSEIFLRDKKELILDIGSTTNIYSEIVKYGNHKYIKNKSNCLLLSTDPNDVIIDSYERKNLMVILSQKKNDIELCQNRFLEDIIKLLNLDYESYKLKKNKIYTSLNQKVPDLFKLYSVRELDNLFFNNVEEYGNYINLMIDYITKAFSFDEFKIETKTEDKIFIYKNKFLIFFIFFPVYLLLIYIYVPKK